MKKMRVSNELNMNPSIKWINSFLHLIMIYLLSSLYGSLFYVEIEKILNFKVLIIMMIGVGLIFSFINYSRNRKEVLEISNKSLLCFLIVWLGVESRNFWLDKTIYIVEICGILILIYSFSYFISSKRVSKLEIKIEPEFYPSRKNLMEVLSHALGEYSLIALDGTWGSGKTTFMNIAMRENRGKYYYIPINVMLFENRNSLKTEFLNQLKGIFKEEGIFQGSLMDFDYYLDGVSNDWVKVIKNIIFSKSKSFKEANEKLKSEIGKIEKRIVVGVDNLERIYGESEPEWKQILGFIHELQELGIKIVVMANLEEMLTTKKETGEKDLSNHEYFDKFYEFKLKLNEVSTEEIIEEVEIKENTVDREWVKEQIKGLTINLNEGAKKLKSEHLSGNKSEEGKKESEEKMSKYKELQNRYLENIVNPRKIEKVMKDIQTKKNIDNIFNFIEDDEYEKLIFKASMFSLVYFDYMKEIQENGFLELHGKNNFFRYFFLRLGNSSRGINRILFYDSKENLIIDEIKKLISIKEIKLSELDNRLKNLDVYSSTLDPDSDQKITKEAYEIIKEKLLELEEGNIKIIHKIIKENEEFICEMNYLCYPDKVGIYEQLKYNFETISITKSYEKFLRSLDPKGTFSFLQRTQEVFWLVEKYFNLGSLKLKEDEKSIDELIDMIDNKRNPNIIIELKNRSLDLFFSEEAERIKLKRMITLLNILKIELNKQNIKNKKDGLVITAEQWKEPDKLKILQKLKNDYCENYFYKKCEEFKKIRIILEKIIKEEKSDDYILKLERLIKSLKIYELPSQIREMASKIKMEQDSKVQEKKKVELINFINEKTKDKKYKYIYESAWTEWKDRLLDIDVNLNANGSVYDMSEKQNEV